MNRAAAFIAITVFSCLFTHVASGEPPAGFQKLYTSIRKDPSFKVRLQAIRILVKQVKSTKERPDDTVFIVLNEAAERDKEHVVRGLACWAVGEIGDPRGKTTLKHALQDPNSFVRSEAKSAMKSLELKTPIERNALVFGLDDSPDVTATEDVLASLKKLLGEEVQSQANTQFPLIAENAGDAPGYRFGASIAELSRTAEGAGERVTFVVRITITTVPERYLRHVLTARASAVVKGKGAQSVSTRDKIMKAAVTRAVGDSLAALTVQ